ncbi:hypothetical protein D2E23_1232 [Bifidobacterium callimiconis]|uniref:Uncharacterized protein n=1 Tax=Bifidobacterium callimiconis TaxID=2306973 RepID=A0A430FDV4_9BIFI|nr:hypothetical protein D2E23_1232 [Bifidobacterium callimiconis]
MAEFQGAAIPGYFRKNLQIEGWDHARGLINYTASR